MLTRRMFTGATAAVLANTQGCSFEASGDSYPDAVQRTWRLPDPPTVEPSDLERTLVRYATLAPSSHNTQCWRFALAPKHISILPDLARRCPVVDPDDHHVHVSLGCAAENLVHGARAHGLMAEPAFDPARGAIDIALAPTRALSTPLFKALTERQSTRGEYDGQQLSRDELSMLLRAGTSEDAEMTLLTEPRAMERVLEYLVQGNTAQMHDPAFVAELKSWIRFSGADAVRLGDGLYAASSGNPALPAWLGSAMFGLFFTPKAENDKLARQVRSSAGIAVFTARRADKAGWVEVGRCYERFALQAAALGVRNALINQPVEVKAMRASFAASMGLAGPRPDLVARFGRGPRLPRSVRRPVEAVLI
jgi:hypothetical protein